MGDNAINMIDASNSAPTRGKNIRMSKKIKIARIIVATH